MNIIELARQSGGKVWPYAKSVDFSYDELERFAALVRAEERERCAKVAEEAWMPQLIHYPEDQYSVNPNRIGEIRKQQVDLCVKAIRGMKDE